MVTSGRWSGASLKKIEVNPDDCTLDMESVAGSISESTVLVAVGAASNLSGTINNVRELVGIAHGFGGGCC